MNQERLFNKTRWRLTIWYAAIMGTILGISGLGVYEAISHAHRVTIDREIKSVASTFHNSLELYLQEPGKLDREVNRLFPSLCAIDTECNSNTDLDRHQLNGIDREDYYLNLWDTSGQLVAVAGKSPATTARILTSSSLVHLRDRLGIRYRLISLTLETTDNRAWGYLQVGRSLQDFDRYMLNVGKILLLSFPVAMLLVIISAWYLSKLAMQPLYLSYRQIQQFTGDAAHELRTPLATIRATIESGLLAPVWQENQIKEILATIERQNQRMSNLVADLLTLTRLDRFGSTNLSQEQTSVIVLKDLIEDLIEEFAYLALDSKIELITDIRANSWQIAGNESQIYRLLANILVNAIQYTPDNGKVTIILDKDTHHAIIKIKDTGIGIPEAEKSRIFERFYRVNGDRSRQTGGSGLGLAIALGIAHAHQGSIKVDSEMGNGSIFTIKLPKINLSSL